MRASVTQKTLGITRATGTRKSWLSAHLPLAHNVYSEECDAVIRAHVAPLVRGLRAARLIDGFFFVRYSEGGPHLRIRFRGARACLVEHVVPALRDASIAWAMNGANGSRSVNGSVEWTPYEPEFDRYGGDRALPVAERFFDQSSRFALETLAAGPMGHERRLGAALAAFLCLTNTFMGDVDRGRAFSAAYRTGFLTMFAQTDEAKASFAQQFSQGYETQRELVDRVVAEVWPALQRGQRVGAPFDALIRAARRARRRLQTLAEQGLVRVGAQEPVTSDTALRILLPSYLHLTLNRLGVGLLHESYLASVVESSLGTLSDA